MQPSKRWLVGLMVVAVIPWTAAGTAMGSDHNQFLDTEGVHQTDIEAMAAAGVTTGCNPPDNDRFCPDDSVTRGQMAAFLARALDLASGRANHFDDDDGSLFEDDINRMAAAEITLGCNPPDNSRFCPDDPVTREQMAGFLARALNLAQSRDDHFSDDSGRVLEGEINRLASGGITVGCNPPANDRFCPRGEMTRAQMASFLTRAFGWQPPRVTARPSTAKLVYSTSPDRSNPQALDGATLSGDVYIYAQRLGSGIEQVEFYLGEENVQTEKVAPYDFGGTDGDRPQATASSELGGGQHTVKAVVEYSNGEEKSHSAEFQVDQDASPGSPPPGGGGGWEPPPGTASCGLSDIDMRDAVRISPGDDLAEEVDDNPSGTVFIIEEGVHRGQSVEPKGGNVFIGEGRAVLDGEGEPYAFSRGGTHVTVANLEIHSYDTPQADAAIGPGPGDWCVEGNHVHHNATIGIEVYNRWTVVNNYVHHNGQLGLNGSGEDVLIEGNEIAYNGTCECHIHNEGGTKFVNTENLVVRGNYSHHNHGPGLWTDINNIHTLYEGNRVVANDDSGIFVEISYDTVIRNNDVRDNGQDRDLFWLARAGILVNSSPNVEIYDNTVANNGSGIMARQSDRGDGDYGEHLVKNLRVHHNRISMDEGRSGVWMEDGIQDVFSGSWNNRFHDNDYDLDGNGDYFEWNGAELTLNQWLGLGHG